MRPLHNQIVLARKPFKGTVATNVLNETNEVIEIPSAEEVITGYQNAPTIAYGGGRAFYSPDRDHIQVPVREDFDSPEAFYSTLFHEMVHSTGHKDRLNRPRVQSVSFGSELYSKEELIAEMGSTFLCAMTGISPKVIDNQSAYIANWLKVLKNDKRMVINASSASQKAVDYIKQINQ